MSKQREILPEVIEILQQRYSGCGILLTGSVMRGGERPDSDLDLIVIQTGDREMEISHAWIHQGIVLCMTYFGDQWLEGMLQKQPHWFWPLSQAEILRDPMGLAQRHQSTARTYFANHPKEAEFWKQQTHNYWEQKKTRDGTVQAMSLPDLIRAFDEQHRKAGG